MQSFIPFWHTSHTRWTSSARCTFLQAWMALLSNWWRDNGLRRPSFIFTSPSNPSLLNPPFDNIYNNNNNNHHNYTWTYNFLFPTKIYASQYFHKIPSDILICWITKQKKITFHKYSKLNKHENNFKLRLWNLVYFILWLKRLKSQ